MSDHTLGRTVLTLAILGIWFGSASAIYVLVQAVRL
jgi:hypothetical protein